MWGVRVWGVPFGAEGRAESCSQLLQLSQESGTAFTSLILLSLALRPALMGM